MRRRRKTSTYSSVYSQSLHPQLLSKENPPGPRFPKVGKTFTNSSRIRGSPEMGFLVPDAIVFSIL